MAELDLVGKRQFSAGSVKRLPFSIDVPAHAGPTTAHSSARVEWRVEAVLDRRMRGDLAVETPLVVLSRPLTPPAMRARLPSPAPLSVAGQSHLTAQLRYQRVSPVAHVARGLAC